MLIGLPKPQPDLDTERFWEALGDHKFLYQKCSLCEKTRWPPGPMCPNCQSMRYSWIEATGRGRIYSWIVVHHGGHPALSDQVPYVVALVEIDENTRVVSNIITDSPDDLRAGTEVELVFESAEGQVLPNFRVSS